MDDCLVCRVEFISTLHNIVILLATEVFVGYLWDGELASCLHEYLAIQSWKVSR